MLSPFPYIFACLFLSLLFRQSLLYDSQFNISIRTRLISTVSRENAKRSLTFFTRLVGHWRSQRYTVNSRLRLKNKVQLFSAQFSAQFTRNCPFVWKADGLE
jgi:predicted membrane metal-binding protein